MQPFSIRTRADVVRIEGAPYREFMPHASVFDALEAVALRHADRTALRFIPCGELSRSSRTWTYREFLEQVGRAANLFHSLAPGGEARVAILLPAIPEAYFALWGAEAAGVVCPINYLLGADHIAELIRACGANILVALGPNEGLDIWSRVAGLLGRCPGLRQVLAVGGAQGVPTFEAALETQSARPGAFRQPARADRLAALFHTGGTTGTPKLAQHTHGNQLHAAWGAAGMYAMNEHDKILNGFPLFHVAGAFVFGLSALLSGAEVVLPTLTGLRNADFMQRYWHFVDREKVSLLAAVPTVISTLLNIKPGTARLDSVRALLTGGSPLPTELALAFEQRFQKPVRNILGMTECAGVISIEPALSPRTPGSCGLALPFVDVKAVRADGSDCAVGESGVLRLRGPNVGPGYTDPAKNLGAFTSDGWLITGDRGHVDDDGRIFITGREKDLIIRSSHNIDPLVIEEALLQHPLVLVAAAVGEPDEYAGELPVAFVSLKPGAVVDVDELMAFAQQRIPERPAFPKRIDVVASIPTTAIGKVYKPALRAIACERALQERLTAAGISRQVKLVVDEAPGGLKLRFMLQAPAERAQVDARLAELMQAFALDWRVVS